MHLVGGLVVVDEVAQPVSGGVLGVAVGRDPTQRRPAELARHLGTGCGHERDGQVGGLHQPGLAGGRGREGAGPVARTLGGDQAQPLLGARVREAGDDEVGAVGRGLDDLLDPGVDGPDLLGPAAGRGLLALGDLLGVAHRAHVDERDRTRREGGGQPLR